MAKNSKPRKKYRPLRAQVDPLLMLRAHSTQRLGLDQVRDLQIGAHSSLMAIERGSGTQDDMEQLAITSNVALIMAEGGLGEEFIPEVKEAQRHLLLLQKRLDESGKVGLTGEGMQAVRRLMELHDAQLDHPDCTEGRMTRVLLEIQDRMDAGHVQWRPE